MLDIWPPDHLPCDQVWAFTYNPHAPILLGFTCWQSGPSCSLMAPQDGAFIHPPTPPDFKKTLVTNPTSLQGPVYIYIYISHFKVIRIDHLVVFS